MNELHPRPGRDAAGATGSHAAETGNDAAETPRVLLFFDYACSFCYVDTYRFARLSRDRSVDVVHIPFELRPDAPAGGISARAAGLEHSERVEDHLRRLAAEEGIPYDTQDSIPNTHKAMALAESARDAGLHQTVHEAVFRAYFGEGRDIGDETVLLDIAAASGLDPEDVVDAWATGRHEDRLHAFMHLGSDLGVRATPAALICNELLIGTRPYGVIRDAVDRCLVTRDNVEQRTREARGGEATDAGAIES
jgi:predicted DsbA family dithiol-disulfide isomerase